MTIYGHKLITHVLGLLTKRLTTQDQSDLAAFRGAQLDRITDSIHANSIAAARACAEGNELLTSVAVAAIV